MAIESVREWIEILDRSGELKRVTAEVDPHLEIAAITDRVGNIDRVGMALFQGHPLGIELAGVILLLSMVGAIVIGRKRVFVDGDTHAPDLAFMHADDPLDAASAGEQGG